MGYEEKRIILQDPRRDVIWFGNGSTGELLDVQDLGTNEKGIEIIGLIIRPFDDFRHINNVQKEEDIGFIRVVVPKYMLVDLQLTPSWRIKLVLCGPKQEETPLTRLHKELTLKIETTESQNSMLKLQVDSLDEQVKTLIEKQLESIKDVDKVTEEIAEKVAAKLASILGRQYGEEPR